MRFPACVPGILAVAVGLVSLRARAADPAKEAEGRKAFNAGVILLQDPDGAKYDEAIVQFRRAYTLVGSWKVLGNLGLCALKLERDGEAIEAYEKYLAAGRDAIDAQERAQVQKDLHALRTQVVSLHLEFSSAGATVTDARDARGTKIVNKYEAAGRVLDIKVHPGDHHLTAHASDGQGVWEANLAAGASISHGFELVSLQAAAPPAVATPAAPATNRDAVDRIPVYVLAGAGAVGLALGSVFGLEAMAEKNKRDGFCSGGTCSSPEGLEHDSAARKDAIISTIAFSAGIASAGIAAVLFFGSKSDPSVGGVWIAPRVTGSRTQIELGASF